MSRPPKDLNVEQIKKLAAIQCTMIEIASVMDCSVDTLERRFADVIKSAREGGRMSLRRMQWESASKGNYAMLIWLGKQYLGQKENYDDRFQEKPAASVYKLHDSSTDKKTG